MGKITSIIANHNLDTSTLQKLASDISECLQATIVYGYLTENTYLASENKFIENYGTVILGEITLANTKKKLTLIDTQFEDKEFIKSYGLEELKKPFFKKDTYYKTKILDAQKSIEFYLEDENEEKIAEIYRDTIDLNMVDCLDWRNFERTFIYKNDKDTLAYLNKWRTKNRDWVYTFGGDYMLIFHGENECEFIHNDVVFKTGKAIKKKITKKLKGHIVNMSKYLKSEAQQNKPEYVQPYLDDAFFKKMNHAINNKLPFDKVKIKYPCVVYDDFQDLENSIPLTTNEFDFMYDGSEILKQLTINESYQKTINSPKINQ